ncbi:MAG TPA: hypothetical protein VM600_05170, partial [Actinomycetota bacterium]|nr:hypothetical protein [Actinomycetota bacterium]
MLRNPLLSRARFVRIVALRVGVVALVIALSGAYLVNRPNTALVITPSFMSVTANPTTADGGAQWTNPAGAIDAGDGVSCASTSGNNQNLRLTSLGFAIPSDASISGVTVVVKGARTGAAQNPNRLTTSLLGVTNGTPKPANYANVSTCAGTADVTLGGSADLWGATISAAQVNSTTFGVMIDPNANVSMANVDFVT